MWSTIWDPEIQDVQWHCFIWPMSHGLMHKLQRWITLRESVRSNTSTLSHISNKYMNYCSLQQILLSAKKPNRPWKILLWFRTYSTLSSNLTSINIMPFHRKPNVFWQNDRMPHIHSGGAGPPVNRRTIRRSQDCHRVRKCDMLYLVRCWEHILLICVCRSLLTYSNSGHCTARMASHTINPHLYVSLVKHCLCGRIDTSLKIHMVTFLWLTYCRKHDSKVIHFLKEH